MPACRPLTAALDGRVLMRAALAAPLIPALSGLLMRKTSPGSLLDWLSCLRCWMGPALTGRARDRKWLGGLTAATGDARPV